VRSFTFESGLHTYGALLRRLAQGLLERPGPSPAVLLESLSVVAALYERGSRHVYVASGPHTGRVEVYLAEPAPRLTFVAWEGLYSLAFELTRWPGTVSLSAVVEGGGHGRYLVSW
jgi:hypothetical protein